MKNNRLPIYALIALLFVMFTGCISVNRQFSVMKDKLLGKMGDEYKTQFQFSVGSAGITLSSWIVDVAQDDEYVAEMMREISNVQVGVYEKESGESDSPDFSTLLNIDKEMKNNGWKFIVRSIEHNEASAIYVSSDPELLLKKMFIIHLEEEQLVMLEIEGELGKLIETAIRDKNFNFNM